MDGRLTFSLDWAGSRLNAARCPPLHVSPSPSFPPLHGALTLMAMQARPPLPPRAPMPVTEQLVKTPGLLPMPPSPGVMVAVDPSVVAQLLVAVSPSFPLRIVRRFSRTGTPFPSCAPGACDGTTGGDAGAIPYATVAGGDGGDRPVDSG